VEHTITEKCDGCTACVRVCPTRAIRGVRKERHVIDPDKCVDCGVCGMTCPVPGAITGPGGKMCVMVKAKDRPKPQSIRAARCVSCNLCVEVCPFACLELELPATKIDKRPVPRLAHEKRCVSCRLCVDICPTVYLEMRKVA
jgi:Na+-translocating ferredoxin:NAD+ oxidoreductase subunit B